MQYDDLTKCIVVPPFLISPKQIPSAAGIFGSCCFFLNFSNSIGDALSFAIVRSAFTTHPPLRRESPLIGWVYPLRTVDSTLFPKIIRLIIPPIPSDTLETGMVMIMIIVMCAQYGIQYLMTIYPPVILFMPIKPTQKKLYVFNIFSFKSAKFLEVKCVFSLNLTVFKV